MPVGEHWKRDINESLLIGYQSGSHHQTTDWGRFIKQKKETVRDFVCMSFKEFISARFISLCFSISLVMRGHWYPVRDRDNLIMRRRKIYRLMKKREINQNNKGQWRRLLECFRMNAKLRNFSLIFEGRKWFSECEDKVIALNWMKEFLFRIPAQNRLKDRSV